MKLLLLNPNTSVSVTDRIMDAARSVAAPGTELVGMTAPRGVPYIATRAEAVIGGAVALEVLAEHHTQFDAAIIAAFADPALPGARELLPIPVLGLAESAMLTACMLGRRFSIVSFAVALEPWYRECVEYNGLQNRLASIRIDEGGFASIGTVRDEKADRLVALAHDAVARDGADVIILAGAPPAGLAAAVRERIPVPVIDGVTAAVKQAEALVGLAPRKPVAGSFRRPGDKPSTGLPDALARLVAGRD